MNTFLTVKDVAARLSCTEYTIRHKINTGELKAKKKGLRWYILLKDFEEYMNS